MLNKIVKLKEKIPEQLIYDILLITSLVLIFSGMFFFLQGKENEVQTSEFTAYQIEDYTLDYQALKNEEGGEVPKQVKVKIPEGSTTLEIAYILERKEVMSASEFLEFVDLFSIEKRIKAGEYYFKENITTGELFSKILIE